AALVLRCSPLNRALVCQNLKVEFLMEEYLKIIIPLIAVVLGWLLGQLSGLFAIGREEKQFRSSALPAMLDLYFQKNRIDHVLAFFNGKLGDSMEKLHEIFEKHGADLDSRRRLIDELMSKFESSRQVNLDLPEKNKISLDKSVERSIIELSKVDAVSAYKLDRIYNEFILLMEIRFPEKEIDATYYLDVWSELLGVFRQDLRTLRKLILKVARSISFCDYIKVLMLLRAEEKLLKSVPKESLESILKIKRRASS
ncbi:hypothetical protein, partial [Vibrio parahaemolyticus]|uniref:hypothetical protein n=2 Tax=Vibrio parahaemolyticus TaxID=670 RepID=UPI001C5F03B9